MRMQGPCRGRSVFGLALVSAGGAPQGGRWHPEWFRCWPRRVSKMTFRHMLAAFAVSIACLDAVQTVAEEALTEEERGWLAKASREEVNGWIWLRWEPRAVTS